MCLIIYIVQYVTSSLSSLPCGWKTKHIWPLDMGDILKHHDALLWYWLCLLWNSWLHDLINILGNSCQGINDMYIIWYSFLLENVSDWNIGLKVSWTAWIWNQALNNYILLLSSKLCREGCNAELIDLLMRRLFVFYKQCCFLLNSALLALTLWRAKEEEEGLSSVWCVFLIHTSSQHSIFVW